MSDLIGQPFFLLGVVLLAAGVGAVAVKAFGVEVGAATPGRATALAVVGALVMTGGWWAADEAEFEVTAVEIRWESPLTLQCDSVQPYLGAIETKGDPQPVTYRVVTDGRVLAQESITPTGGGRTVINGRARVVGRGSSFPELGDGLGIQLEVLAPVVLRSEIARLSSVPTCGALFAEPVPAG